MFCHKCGNRMVDESEFCHKCGSKAVTDVTETEIHSIPASILTPPPKKPIEDTSQAPKKQQVHNTCSKCGRHLKKKATSCPVCDNVHQRTSSSQQTSPSQQPMTVRDELRMGCLTHVLGLLMIGGAAIWFFFGEPNILTAVLLVAGIITFFMDDLRSYF